MISHGNEIKIFSGNSNKPLAEAIAKKLNTTLGEMEVTKPFAVWTCFSFSLPAIP